MGVRRSVKITSPLTAFGDLRTAELTPIFQGSFEYTVGNTELTENTVVADGTVTQASGMAVLGSSATTASSALLLTKRHARYRAGLGGLLRFTTLFTAGVATTEQYGGIIDEAGSSAAFKNGLAVGYDGATFGFHRFQNDVKFSVDQADWFDPLDGTGASGMTLDQTKLNVWAIRFQYLGAGAMELYVESDRTGQLVLVHQIKYANQNITPSSFNPNYHFMLWVNNAGTTSDIVMKCASYAYFTEGKARYSEIHQPQQSSGTVQKTSVTTEVALFSIRNKAAYAGKTNFIDMMLELISVSIEAGAANNLGTIRVVRDATIGGTPSWSDINTTDSVAEIDTAGTTVTGGKELFAVDLAGKNDKIILNLLDFLFLLAEIEMVTVSASSVASATINGSLLWKELF